MPTPNDFLGRGWSFPPSFNVQLQNVEMTEKEEDIRKSLEILLTTAIGERVMQPKYGCNLDDLVFESLNTTMKTFIKEKIKNAILFFEPRIDAKRIEINSENELQGVLLIEIDYIVRATNSRFNFVFPYYKNEGTELNTITTNITAAL